MANKKRTQSRRQSGHNQKDKVMAKEINKTYQQTQDFVPEKPIEILGTQIPSNTRDRIVIGVGISAIMIIIVLFLIL
jgi:preprotein translocase subunit SecF